MTIMNNSPSFDNSLASKANCNAACSSDLQSEKEQFTRFKMHVYPILRLKRVFFYRSAANIHFGGEMIKQVITPTE